MLLPFLASHCCRCIAHGDGGVPPRGCFHRLHRFVVVVFVGILPSLLAMCCSRRRRHPFSWLIFPASAPRRRWRRWPLVVIVGVSLPSAASLCHCRCQILVVIVGVLWLSLASCRRRCFVVVGSGFPPCVLPSNSTPHCCCRHRHLVVVFAFGVPSLSAASR